MEGQKAQPREHYLQKHYINKSDVEDLQILTAARLDMENLIATAFFIIRENNNILIALN